MKEQLDKLEYEELKPKVKELIDRIRKEKNLNITEIAAAIQIDKESFYKWASGKNFPKKKDIKSVLENLEDVLKQYPLPESLSVVEDKFPGYEKKKRLVSIFFGPDEKTALYTGEQRVGTIAEVNGKPAIIAYQNDSVLYDAADGLIPMHDAGMEPDIKRGSSVAIRKIDIMDCLPGYTYCIIDKSNQIVLRKLLKKEDEMFKLVSENENNFPDITIELSRISAIFRASAVLFPL
jgi:transcriptional regulator with XRE-family HTH domain